MENDALLIASLDGVSDRREAVRQCSKLFQKCLIRFGNEVCFAWWKLAFANSIKLNSPPRILGLLYVINDIVHHPANNQFVHSFSHDVVDCVPAAVNSFMSCKDNRAIDKIIRILQVWQEKRIFAHDVCESLLFSIEKGVLNREGSSSQMQTASSGESAPVPPLEPLHCAVTGAWRAAPSTDMAFPEPQSPMRTAISTPSPAEAPVATWNSNACAAWHGPPCWGMTLPDAAGIAPIARQPARANGLSGHLPPALADTPPPPSPCAPPLFLSHAPFPPPRAPPPSPPCALPPSPSRQRHSPPRPHWIGGHYIHPANPPEAGDPGPPDRSSDR